MSDRYDAVVVGGGPAGATAAILLTQAGWSVAVVERKVFPRRKVCGEFISATSLPVLRLGVADLFMASAGPPVERVGLFVGNAEIVAAMPGAAPGGDGWGRALGREELDRVLLERAAAIGAEVWQPWTVTGLTSEAGGSLCRIENESDRSTRELRADIVIAAHGSWEPGKLPTRPQWRPAGPNDLLGFKAHFVGSDLAPGLMPLLAFPGGYGGMVETNAGRVSLSCCVRRVQVERSRREAGSASAAEAVMAHIERACLGVRRALARAERQGAWLSAGPIRPGIRGFGLDRVFLVGNAAGEAHPVVAEGISMAMQSSGILCEWLIQARAVAGSDAALEAVRRAYGAAWRRAFARRLRVAAMVANLAMRPSACAALRPLLQVFPSFLTAAARWSGKVERAGSGVLELSVPR